MVLRPIADAEILPWAAGASAEASSSGSEFDPTAVDRSPVVYILCMSEQDVSVYAARLFVRRYLDSISTHKE